MKRSWVRRGLLSLLCLVTLVSCGQFGKTPPDNSSTRGQSGIELIDSTPKPVASLLSPSTPFPTEVIVRGTVSIRHSWNESQLPVLAQIIKSFQLVYPNVLFDVLYIPLDNLRARYELDTQEGIGPTLLLGPSEWGPGLFQAGLTADLTSLVSDNLLKTLNQPVLRAAKLDEKLVGLPYSIQGVVLYRNKDIITLAPNTFDDLLMLAQTSTEGSDIGAYLDRSFFYSGGHLAGLGGQLIGDDRAPAFNSAAGLAWLELLKKFEEAGPTDFYTDADLERFKQGKVGWIIDGTWNMRSLSEALGEGKLAIDPWPTYEDGRLSGFVLSDNLYLSARVEGEDHTATLRFIEYLLSSEAQTLMIDAGRIPAARVVSPTDPIFGPLTIQAITALADGAAYPIIPETSLYSTNLDISLRAFFEHGNTAEQALQSAQDAILAVLAQSQVDSTPIP